MPLSMRMRLPFTSSGKYIGVSLPRTAASLLDAVEAGFFCQLEGFRGLHVQRAALVTQAASTNYSKPCSKGRRRHGLCGILERR